MTTSVLPETLPLTKVHVSWPTNLGNISIHAAFVTPYLGVFWVATPEANELCLVFPAILAIIGIPMWVFGTQGRVIYFLRTR